MADNLIFPIGFDLEKAVEQAGKDWNSKYADKLEKLIAKRLVNVKLNLDTKNLDSLDAVKKRLAELKIEPITPETKSAIKELTSELRQLAKALETLQKYSKNPTKGAVDTSKVQLNEARAKAQAALAAQRTAKAEDNLAAARLKAARAANVHASATRNASKAYGEQSTYLDRLIKRIAVYWSIRQVGNFLTNVREVTAEFELQRVSLGAIIQDQQRANQLFAEIKSFALKSPVSILDLTKYTKQLAAYKVGWDGVKTDTKELFDWTKKLTDVSVGLGVSMDRVVLAFGQVRATGYLRASEVRQFTEMGVPIVEELAAKLSKLNGEAVTAADVMDMISKRGISFELVKEVFDDMTSAGGMFYNMQEKQGNTLFGLWAKLGDAASVMYDEIGNTSSVNSGMKEVIRLLSDLMRNWRNVGLVVAESAAVFAIWKLQAVNAALVTNALTAAEVRALAVKKVHYKMQPAIIRGIIGETNARKLSIITVRAHAAAVRASATSTNIFTKAWYSLKAAFLSNPFGIALTALAAIATYLMFADDKVKRFKEDLDSIKEGGVVEATKSAYNFEQLAEKAVNAADGSMEQKDALDELQRTYKDMIPIQDLTIEKLKALKGDYDSLTQSIKEYVYQRNLQQQIDRIIEERTGTMTRIEQKLRDELKEGVKYQVSDAVHTKDLGIDDNQISALFSRIKTEAKNTTKDVQTIIRESVDEIFGYLSQEDRNILYAVGLNKLTGATDGWLNTLQSIIELQRAMDGEIENASTSMSQYTGYLGEYKKELDNITESVKKYRLVNTKGEAVGRDTFLFQQGQQNFQIKKWADSIKSELEGAGVTIQEGIFNLVDKINENDPTKISTIDFSKLMPMLDSPKVKQKLGNSYETFKDYVLSIQKLYNGIVPSDPIVQAVRNSMFAIGNATKGGMDVMKKYLWDGKTSIKEHLKTLKASSDTLQAELYKYANYIKKYGILGKAALLLRGIDYDALAAEYDALTKQIEYVQTYVKEEDSTQSDPRLGILQEMVSTLKQVNKEYDDLAKKEGATNALADTQKTYADTFKNMQALAKQYKFELPDFGVPTDTASLTKYLDAIKKAMAKLPKSDKAVLSLQVDTDKLNIDEKQKQIEKQLKELSDRISRTKTAKEFYDKILGQTGDLDLAANVTMSVYGETGSGLFDAVVSQIQETFKTGNIEVDTQIGIDLQGVIDTENERINYAELARIYDKYQDQIIAKNRNTAENIIKEGQKTAASNIAMWEKELAKAKDYEEQRTDIINRETQRRAEIYKSNLPQEEKDRLAAQSQRKQDEDLAKVNFEEFTKSEDYIKIFEDLDNVATSSLKRLRAEMQALIDTNQNLSPENMKTLVKAMEDIDEQISGRSFGNDMIQSVNDYITSIRNLKIAKQELAKAEAEYQAQLPQLDENIALAEAEKVEAQRVLNELKNNELATENQIVAAELRLNTATANVAKAEQAKAKAANKVKKAEQKVTDEQDKQKKATTKFFKDLQKVGQAADQLAGTLGDIKGLLGIAEDSAAGLVFDSAIEGLQQMSNLIGIVTAAQMLYNVVTASNPWLAIASAVLAVISALSFGIGAAKVRKANKEIEKQQDLLDQLEYTYGRLEKAADKVFGRDYVNNYNQQLKNLQAQQQAYLKQAEAERSKGKKKDKDKIKEYEEQARETADKIKELQDDLVAHFTGSSKTDVARQMAQSWIEARASMSDTFAAIKGDYQDLIKNMIVEGAAARVIENALTPVWDSMDKMLEKNNVQGAIDSLIGGMDAALSQANNGMEVLWKALEARGYDMKKLIGDTDSEYSGIAKSVAGATSEEINNVAAIGNTLMYYVSPIPRIDENLARVVAIMEGGGTSAIPQATSAGWTDWQQQAMDNYNAIARNTADTVIECRRAAAACEDILSQLGRVIRPKGSPSSHSVSTTIN